MELESQLPHKVLLLGVWSTGQGHRQDLVLVRHEEPQDPPETC